MTWKSGRWIQLVAAAALLAAGCGSGTPSATGSVTSPTPTSTVNVTPTSNTSLALVNLRGVSHIVVRDLSDIGHPTTLAALGMSPPQPQFVSATEFAYLDPDVIGDYATYPANLVRVPFGGSPKTLVASAVHGIFLYAFAPDGRTAAYLSTHSFGSELHLVTSGNDRLVSSMPPILGGCESPSCGFGMDFRFMYSPDGKFISLSQTVGGPNFRLWSSDGKLLKSNPDGSSYSMSAWSGSSLYFVDAGGVEVWRDGVTSVFLPGVHWLRPKASPDGTQIVYAASDSAGSTHVYVVNTATKSVREIKKFRREPVFLTSRYLWYEGERACQTADHCDKSLPVTPNGINYIYDLQDGTEATSIIDRVYDVWPRPA
jgi:hypothetical protein